MFRPTCELECQSEQCLLKPLEDQNRSRRLQSLLAGTDIEEAQYETAQLPLRIPTEVLNLEEDSVPDRVLQLYLNNFRANSNPPSTAAIAETVVEETVEEGTAEAILLSTTFSSGYGNSYNYEMSDLRDVVRNRPSYIKITRTPINGEIVVKKLGQNVVLQAGDVIETSMLEEFLYDQGSDVCTAENLGRCTDGFSYIPYGEWVGTGDYQKTSIRISPTQGANA